jgi:hypothetical protein
MIDPFASSSAELEAEAIRLRHEATTLPGGPQRNGMLIEARQLEAAAHIDDWLNSPGLQPPR